MVALSRCLASLGLVLTCVNGRRNLEESGSAARSASLCKAPVEGEPLLANPAKVCVADKQPGLSNRNESSMEFEGLEPDVARLIVETLNGPDARLEFVVTSFPDRIDFLRDCKCDFLVELLTNTAGRRKKVGFTSPYLSPALEVLVLGTSSVTKVEDCGNVAVVKNSATKSSFESQFPSMNLITFDTNVEAVKSLVETKSSCVASEDIILKRILEQVTATEIDLLASSRRDDFRRVSTGNTFAPKPWGVGVNIDRVGLRSEIDAVVIYAEMSGKMMNLREMHGFASLLVK